MQYLRVCGDAGVNQPAMLPAALKCSTYNYVQYPILENDNKKLCYWLMYLLYYIFHYFILIKKILL